MDHNVVAPAPMYPYVELKEQPRKEPPTTPSALPPAPPTHLLLGPENTVTTCPFCHSSIKTAVKYTNNTGTHIAAALSATICCCCCIPYCSESAKNTDHYCPNCERYLGTYRK